MHICLGWNFYLSTILMLAITALYTIAGTAPGPVGGHPGERGPDRWAGRRCPNLEASRAHRQEPEAGPPAPTALDSCSPAVLAQLPAPTRTHRGRAGPGCGAAGPPGALESLPGPCSSRPGPSSSLSAAGGLAAVIYTDALQTLIMVVGAVILTVKGEGYGLAGRPAARPLGPGRRHRAGSGLEGEAGPRADVQTTVRPQTCLGVCSGCEEPCTRAPEALGRRRRAGRGGPDPGRGCPGAPGTPRSWKNASRARTPQRVARGL